MTALITELERGSSVDGPGIRTVVFLKGCPLHCLWCHNPETIRREPEIIRDLKRCVNCGLCQTLPPNEAEKRCPVHAAEITGHLLSIEDFQHIVLRDAKFISNGGGVTFSGGEPLMQADWVAEAAHFCKINFIHTALDTTLYPEWSTICKVLDDIDLFLVDIKHWDSAEHRRFTGVGNERILENLQRLDEAEKSILIRTPLIPEVNDSPECIAKILEIEKNVRHLVRGEFLPYNPLTPYKYERLGRCFPLEIHRESDFASIRKQLEKSGLPVLLAK